MLHRFHCPLPLSEGSELALPDKVAHHVRRVLRMQTGDRLILFDGLGGEYRARVETIGSEVRVRIEAFDAVEREAPVAIVLAQGLAASERMDFVMQKAAEVGIARIIPVQTVRSIVHLDADRARRRLAHWQGIAVAASEQCGRNRLPVVESIVTLPQFLASSREHGDSVRVVLDPEASVRLSQRVRRQPLCVLVGPEGGLADEEIHMAVRAGFEPTGLGPRIFRTETVGVIAASVWLTGLGEF